MHHLADSMPDLCNSGKHNNARGRDLQNTTLLEEKLSFGEEAKLVAIGKGMYLIV